MLTAHKHIKYRPDIDGLRAIAVFAVVLFHFEFDFFKGGYIGVDIFFVISGFLITKIITREITTTGTFDIKNFYYRRTKRILPVYLACIFVSAAIGAMLLSVTHLQRFGESVKASVLMLTNIHFFFNSDYFDLSAATKPLLHLWSLSIEEQFYIIWPLTLFLIIKKTKRNAFPCIAAIILMSLALNLYEHIADHALISEMFIKETTNLNVKPELFFLLPFRIYEFLIGATLVFLPHKDTRKSLTTTFCILGFALIIISSITFDERMLFPSYYGLLPSIGTALILYFNYNNIVSRALGHPWLVSVGKVSYSFYLIHWPVFVFMNYLKFFQDGHLNFRKNIVIIVCLGLSYTSYHLIEQPFRKPSKYDREIIITILILLIIAFGLGNSFSKSGWPERLTTNFDFSTAEGYHRKFYGGAGYKNTTIYNKNNIANIILLGDSHALHYAHGLIHDFVKTNNVNFFSFKGPSCLHLPDFSRVTKGVDWDEICQKSLEKALMVVKESHLPSIIILSHYWGFQKERGKHLKEPSNSISTKQIINGIKKLKKKIGDNSLVVIGNVPMTLPIWVSEELSMPKFYRKIIPIPQTVYVNPIKNIDKYTIEFNLALDKIHNPKAKVYTLNPFDALCMPNKQECANVINGEIMYSDPDHLSKAGSLFVIKFFKKDLEKVLLDSIRKKR